MRYYERIDGSKYRNIWVVGDLHGCYTNLMNKLDTIGFDTKKDLLISVGDLVDRGAENVECLELITFPWFRAVRGNHEQMMIDGLSERGNSLTGQLWYGGSREHGRLLGFVAAYVLISDLSKFHCHNADILCHYWLRLYALWQVMKN